MVVELNALAAKSIPLSRYLSCPQFLERLTQVSQHLIEQISVRLKATNMFLLVIQPDANLSGRPDKDYHFHAIPTNSRSQREQTPA